MLNFNMDLQKQDNFSKAFTARQGDAGEQFSVTLFDNQVPYVPASGDVVSLRVVTPSGKFASVAGTMSGNKATFTLNGQITSEAGYYQRAYVAVSNGTKLRTTQDLIFFSLGNSDINKGQADYYVAELDKLLQQLNEEFDEWLAEREQDYSDLLARIVALTNRVTGLEQDVQDLIDAIQANRINTTNVFNISLLTKPEGRLRRNVGGGSFEAIAWGARLFEVDQVNQMFKPNTTYHVKYTVELMTLQGGAIFANQRAHGAMNLYSSVNNTLYPTIWIGQGAVDDFKDLKVGDRIEREVTFTTPDEATWNAAKYQILGYSRRDVNGVLDRVRFIDVMVQEGSVFTGHQISPKDVLTSFDEIRLKKSVLIDPKMTGTHPPTIEGGTGTPTTEVTFLDTGVMQIKNLLETGRARVYWTATQLGLDSADALGAFEIRVKMRQVASTGATNVEFGYSGGQDNALFNVDESGTWQVFTAVIKPDINSAFCIYIGTGVTIQISELYIYPASTDVTSKRIERIETETAKIIPIELATVAIPDTLQNPNANTLTQSGRWKVYAGTNMPPLPTSSGSYYFYLEVIQFNSDNCIQHAYLRYSGSPSSANGNYEYSRQLVNGSWGPWQRYELETTDGNNFSKASVDLNEETIGGKYIYINPTSAPKSGTFYGEVIRYGGAYIMQRLTNVNATDETFQRVCINTAWQPWRKISIVPASGNINQQQAMDFNTVTDSGNFMNVAATLNCPNNETGSTWYVEVIKYSSNYLYQRATKVAASNATYDRQYLNGIWQPWQQITKTTT